MIGLKKVVCHRDKRECDQLIQTFSLWNDDGGICNIIAGVLVLCGVLLDRDSCTEKRPMDIIALT